MDVKNMSPTNSQIIEFLQSKIVDIKHTIEARRQAAETWAGGSESDWEATAKAIGGATIGKIARLMEAKKNRTIMERNQRELEMLQALLDRMNREEPRVHGI